jgi:uncharacterized protein YbjT (DUF2867 family)
MSFARQVLLVGSNGLVGSAIASRLSADGYQVTGLSRTGSAPFGTSRTIAADLKHLTRASEWSSHLRGVFAVIYCAGTLQDGPRESTEVVHCEAVAALAEACEAAGIRRLIHFSAMGVEKARPSAFSDTKFRGDERLTSRDLDWVILRPSVILGRPAYGGSALMLGLAAMPILPLMPKTGVLQVVDLDDVVDSVVALLAPDAPSKVALELAGPERLEFNEVVALYRAWLGWKPAKEVPLPDWVAALLYRAGDVAGALGWRPPVRTTARQEIARGAVGDPRQWIEATGLAPKSLREALTGRPPTVQDRWFSALYFLKALIFVILPWFWITTGIISLTTGFDIGVRYMLAGGAGPLAGPSVVAGALADIAIGLAIAWRRSTRLGLWGGIGLSLFYAVAGTIILPVLWADPLGPMLKIWPILVLHFVALAILRDR